MEMNTRVQVRSNQLLKDEAAALLEDMGLDMTTAVNMLLKEIVNERKFPFQPKAPSFESAVLTSLDEPSIDVEDDTMFAEMIAHA